MMAPSSHSSVPEATPSPQTGGVQLPGATAFLAWTFPASFLVKLVKLPQ